MNLWTLLDMMYIYSLSNIHICVCLVIGEGKVALGWGDSPQDASASSSEGVRVGFNTQRMRHLKGEC